MPLDRDLLDAVKELDEHDLRRLLILTRAQLQSTGALARAPLRLRPVPRIPLDRRRARAMPFSLNEYRSQVLIRWF